MDSLKNCVNKMHFLTYPYAVKYSFNSRGFRGDEWPEDLSDVVWAIGDSFTLGVGSPLTHTWPHQLQTRLGRRCINVSLDGASNKWISRRTQQIIAEVSPQLVVVQWSFLHRDESPNLDLSDEDRRIHVNLADSELSHLTGFIEAVSGVEEAKSKTNTKVIHSFIPNSATFTTDLKNSWNNICGTDWPQCPQTIEEFNNLPNFVVQEIKSGSNVYEYMYLQLKILDLLNTLLHVPAIEVLDFARDGFHYDHKTSQKFVDDVVSLL